MFKKNTLYNVIFPIWIIPYISFFMIDTWWIALIVLSGNFIIDSLVFLISLKVLKIEEIKSKYEKSIFKIWLFGFLADIIGGVLMIIPEFINENRWIYVNITSKIMWNPYENIYAISWVIMGLLISGYLIYWFNYKVSLKKMDVEIENKKKIACAIAIATAPYLFLIPTVWFYRGY